MKIEKEAEEPKQPAQADSDSAIAKQLLTEALMELVEKYPRLFFTDRPKENTESRQERGRVI